MLQNSYKFVTEGRARLVNIGRLSLYAPVSSLPRSRHALPEHLAPQAHFRNRRFASSPASMGSLASQHMQPVTGSSPSAVSLYDRALWQYTSLSGDPVATISEAIAQDPALVSAHILNAAMHLLSTAVGRENVTVQQALECMAAAVREGRVTPRERRLISAVQALADGRWRLAAAILEQQLAASPCDLLTIRLAHDIYFFLGDSRNLRDSVARAWPAWDPTMPGYGRVTGMLAFGLEECGAYQQAEELAMTAINMDPADAWALHAAVHVYEMAGRREEGKRLLKETEEQWMKANLFDRHLHWHKALLNLEDGTVGYRAAHGIYSDAIGTADRQQALDYVDGTSLLWRMELLHATYTVPVAWTRGAVVQGTLELRLHPALPGDCLAPHSEVGVSALQAHVSARRGGQGRGSAGQWAEQRKKDDEANPSFLSALFGNGHIKDERSRAGPSSSQDVHMSRVQVRALPSRWEEQAEGWRPYLRLQPQVGHTYSRLNAFNDAHMAMTLAWAVRSARGRGADEAAGVHQQALDALLVSMRNDAATVVRGSAVQANDLPDAALAGGVLGVYSMPLAGLPGVRAGSGSDSPSSPIGITAWAQHDNALVNGTVGATVAEAMASFVQEDYSTALQLLLRARSRWPLMGGSHAQRDVFEQTLLHAAVGAGELGTALAIARERVALRPNSAQAWHVLGSLYEWAGRIAEGMPEGAEGAEALTMLQAAIAPGQEINAQQLHARAGDARNRAYVLGINQGPGN